MAADMMVRRNSGETNPKAICQTVNNMPKKCKKVIIAYAIGCFF